MWLLKSDQPTAKKTNKSLDPTNNRTQKFRDEWELKPEFSKRLSRAKNDATGTQEFCKVCGCTIQARLATIRVHGKSSKHLAMMKTTTGTSKACFIRRILVASNAVQTIDNEVIHLIICCLNCIRRD